MKDLLLYNATHDAQLRISMQAGEAPGTTDYVITSYEPQQHVVTVFADNAGSESTGEYRTGMMYTDRSLTGHRDNLTMSGMMAEGSKSFSASYNRQIHNSGTELNVMYSTNSVEIIDGDLEDLDVKGHAYAASVGFTQPLVVTENTRTEASVTYNRQNSETDYMRQKWIIRLAALKFWFLGGGRDKAKPSVGKMIGFGLLMLISLALVANLIIKKRLMSAEQRLIDEGKKVQ